MRLPVVIMLLILVFGATASAQDRTIIGEGRLFNNDYLGDGADRWRTGSYVYSQLRGPRAFDAQKDFAFGDILEYRLRGEIIAANPAAAAPGDRPYAGALSFGVHTHFNDGPTRLSLGADVVAIGPQTGLSRFQENVHDALGMPEPVFLDTQLENSWRLQGSASVAQTYHFGDAVSLRPFVEAQIGTEDILRIGGDVVFGTVGQNALLLRDVTTGQLYRSTDQGDAGFSYVFGADIAHVGSSVFLPEERGVVLRDSRARARAGVHYQHREGVSFFYGLTYLSEEFEGQPSGQVIGSVKLNFNF